MDHIKMPCVLVVDDEPEVIELFRMTLEREDYRVSTALSYRSAIEIIDNEDIDLVIADVYLDDVSPAFDGLTVSAYAKKKDKNIQIIIVTAQPNIEDIKKAGKLDVYDYLEKPVQIPGITRSSARAIERKILLDESDELRRSLDFVRNQLQQNKETFLKFTRELEEDKQRSEKKLEGDRKKLRKAVENIKLGVE